MSTTLVTITRTQTYQPDLSFLAAYNIDVHVYQVHHLTKMVQLPATAAIEYVAAVNACLIYIISSV